MSDPSCSQKISFYVIIKCHIVYVLKITKISLPNFSSWHSTSGLPVKPFGHLQTGLFLKLALQSAFLPHGFGEQGFFFFFETALSGNKMKLD